MPPAPILPAAWRYPAGEAGRDLRLDALRGLCILKMVHNHLPRTPLDELNYWLGFITGAEGFFFISGAVVGIVHGRRMLEQGLAAVSRQVATRGLHLYVANLALVFLFVALEAAGVVRPLLILGPDFAWPRLFAFNHPYALQVLPRYSVFLLATPLALWAVRRGRTGWLLAASGALYVAHFASGRRLTLPFFEDGGTGGFPVAAWQLLFFVGLAIGVHRRRVAAWWNRIPEGWQLAASAALFVGFVLLRRLLMTEAEGARWIFIWLGRPHLGPLRLLNLAAGFAFFFALTDRLWHPIRRSVAPLLLPLGQLALYVFLLHIVWVEAVRALLPALPWTMTGHPWRLTMASALSIGLLWAAARWRLLVGVVPR